jgi:tetratricopeptide (TPR) repeat protein
VSANAGLLALGVQYHERGALREAEQVYCQVLQADPQNPEALFYQGVLDTQLGRPQLAIDHLNQAIAIRPGVAAFHCYLGLAYWAAGQPQEALAAYDLAVRYDPNYADAYNNRGVALQRLGRMAEAAICFEEAVRCNPHFAEACSNLGAAYQDQGRMAEAIASFEHAVRCKPEFAAAHNNLGVAYLAEGRAEEAVACSREAVRLLPDYSEGHYNLGLALKKLDRHDEAIAAFHQALRCRPEYADAYNDVALTFQAQGKLDEALAAFDEAVRLRPDFADAHLGRASTLLLGGDFERGWPEYEWRWRCPGFVAPPLHRSQPAWDGGSLEGRTLLLRAEQGMGDTLQFIRYTQALKERGARIILEGQATLLPLLRTCAGIDQTMLLGDMPPPYDVHAYLLSIPRLVGTKLGSVPAEVPYLTADVSLREQWRNEMEKLPGFKVGISWQGNPGHKNDRNRSFPLAALSPLAKVPGVHLVSLQKGPGSEQFPALAEQFALTEVGSRLDTFMDTAAVLLNLDLVVTADTALAHLAGALAVPVWVPLPFSPDWRWLLDREDSPWYPTMRLFRQPGPRQWTPVFERIAQELSVIA